MNSCIAGRCRRSDQSKKRNSPWVRLRHCASVQRSTKNWIRVKYIVFIRLAEFIYSSPETITDPEREFLETVANVFTIEPDDHAYCMAITEPVPSSEKLDAHQILLVQHNKNPDLHHCLQLHHHDLEGSLWFLHLRRAGIFVLRYIGKDALTVNGQPSRSAKSIGIYTRCSFTRTENSAALL